MIEQVKLQFQEHIRIAENFMESETGLIDVSWAASEMANAVKAGNKLLACGNGGSFSDAQHFASELSGRYRATRPAIAAMALTDGGAITCIGNDFGFNQIFKRQLEAFGREGDVLLCLSTSGNSENVLVAAEYAKRVGIKVVSITGLNAKLKEYSDIHIEIPHVGTADRIQEASILVIHILVMLIEKEIV